MTLDDLSEVAVLRLFLRIESREPKGESNGILATPKERVSEAGRQARKLELEWSGEERKEGRTCEHSQSWPYPRGSLLNA